MFSTHILVSTCGSWNWGTLHCEWAQHISWSQSLVSGFSLSNLVWTNFQQLNTFPLDYTLLYSPFQYFFNSFLLLTGKLVHLYFMFLLQCWFLLLLLYLLVSAFTDFVLFFCPGLSFFWPTYLFVTAFHFFDLVLFALFWDLMGFFERNRYKKR